MKRYVIFVGDEPSLHNADPKVAFVGTRSHAVLLKWFEGFKDFTPQIFNSDTEELRQRILKLSKFQGAVVIALGSTASKRLNNLGVKHYKLPHPSPRNRLLKNKEFINKQIKECYRYIREA